MSESESEAADDQAHGPPDGARRRISAVDRAWIVAIAFLAAVLVATSGALAYSVSKKHTTTPPRAVERAAPSVASSQQLCPLSGLPAPGGTVPDRPAIAVKVDNYPDARPQSGLDQADLVIEEPVEGGITRLVAVFQCQGAPLVGPVRSAREPDVPIVDELSDPILVHVGGIQPVQALVAAADDHDIDLGYQPSAIQNPPGRVAPYDTYTSTQAIWGLVPSDTQPPEPLFTYSNTPASGRKVSSINIPYSSTNNVTWTWSPSAGQWLLSYSGEAATVEGGGQIEVPNVVVQIVNVTYGPWVENSEGGLEVQTQMTGSGPLEVFRNGVEMTGTWERPSLSDTTQLIGSNGQKIALQPGQTWEEIVPTSVPVNTTVSP